ncbi:hypothetical protein AOQ84DRAFT_386515 [Glonium stellatum]|uniref:Uncharacterized protein n=1 Tax=Glonium stellatum TaxID=574774 RepID=A0A8E2F7S6_9PEZI|nr:hypothetical protein AOQ84DRAFT_386515 [Glonium stellatum]
MSADEKTYVANGEVLSSPLLTVRIRTFFEYAFIFVILYLTTLFSLDSYAAARGSQYRITNGEFMPGRRPTQPTPRPGGYRADGSGDRPRRIRTVDDHTSVNLGLKYGGCCGSGCG